MSTAPPPPALRTRLLSVVDVADRLGVSVKTVRRMIARGDLPAHRIGKLLRVSEQALETLLAHTQATRLM
jgi:excisionase family DNA binding protein